MKRFFQTISVFMVATLAAFTTVACDDGTEDPLVLDDAVWTGTVTVDPDGGAAFTLYDAGVEITVSGDGLSADVKMLRARFAAAMPQLDITIPGIALTRVSDTEWTLSAASVVPTIANGPFPQYTITNFEGTIYLKQPMHSSLAGNVQSLLFSMVCMNLPVQFVGTRPIE